MPEQGPPEAELWKRVKEMLGSERLRLGPGWAAILRGHPRRALSVFAWYKFAAKMGAAAGCVLELGCGEGLGVPFLSETAQSYLGIDPDEDAVDLARKTWTSDKVSFRCDEIFGKVHGQFDLVVCHCEGAAASPTSLCETAASNIREDGVAVIGGGEGVGGAMAGVFHNVFAFSLSGEVVQAGLRPGCDRSVYVGCYRRRRAADAP